MRRFRPRRQFAVFYEARHLREKPSICYIRKQSRILGGEADQHLVLVAMHGVAFEAVLEGDSAQWFDQLCREIVASNIRHFVRIVPQPELVGEEAANGTKAAH